MFSTDVCLLYFSPVRDTVVSNDRWGSGVPCHHGDVYTCTDHYNPGNEILVIFVH